MSEHIFRLVIGDWSDDGHGKCVEFIVQSNKSVEEARESYKESCALTGMQLHGSGRDNFTGIEFTYEKEDDYQLCTNYLKNKPSKRILGILTEFKYPGVSELREAYGIEPSQLRDILLWFIGLSLPGFQYEIVEHAAEAFNGWWGPLNIGIGYGCFE